MEQNQKTERDAALEDLEAPVQVLTTAETDRVEGGYFGSANGGVWKVSNGAQEPKPSEYKLTNTVIVSY